MKNTLPRGHKKLLHAWAFYDWANSVYSLVITSAIFPPIFYSAVSKKAYEEGNVPTFLKEVNNENIIFVTTAIAFLVVSILSPILSGIADYSGQKNDLCSSFAT
ncbi:membrane protein [Nonlabens ulvanivorans]|nr:membrane protein [Nonlabens ulvanivorans]